MPKIRQRDVPWAVLRHLLDRARDREITTAQLGLLNDWINTEPEVPHGPWFKRFPGMIACGEGDLLKTFLRVGQAPSGEEVR
ncbi:MAG TPA: hypothetical protein VGO11_22690 [Chthoniobacteraceae bacterium]|jgi:hypothetical protein|nr:hypothetical protein [Chthoniobacteraceae bacterium]